MYQDVSVHLQNTDVHNRSVPYWVFLEMYFFPFDLLVPQMPHLHIQTATFLHTVYTDFWSELTFREI